MGFSSDAGYIPLTIDELMDLVRINVNAEFGTTYIPENWVGSNFYKFFYSLMQRLQENEVKTSEIFLKMQQFFAVTNEQVLRPNTTHPGIYDYFLSKGYLSSTKEPLDVDAGKLFICVDVDETLPTYPATKLEICGLVKDCAVAGVVSQGAQVETITLDNSQSFDFKFALPTRIPVFIRLTITLSENNLFAVEDIVVIKNLLIANIAARYRLGKNFEPQRYFSVANAPWAGQVLLEWSTDNINWSSSIYESAFNELFVIDPDDVSILEV